MVNQVGLGIITVQIDPFIVLVATLKLSICAKVGCSEYTSIIKL